MSINMQQNRTIKELLQLLLDNPKWFNTGLCGWVIYTFHNSDMTHHEKYMLLDYINDNRPSIWSSIDAFKCRNTNYYWKFGNITPRIKWLKKHIKLNS